MSNPSAPPPAARLTLTDYYGIEALNSLGGMLFLYCVFFWARGRYGYSDTENLLLGAVNGLVYIFASVYGGRLADRFGYDRLLCVGVAGLGCVMLTGWLPQWAAMPFVVMVLFTLFQAPTWPALEAAVVHVPGKLKLADRVGLYLLRRQRLAGDRPG